MSETVYRNPEIYRHYMAEYDENSIFDYKANAGCDVCLDERENFRPHCFMVSLSGGASMPYIKSLLPFRVKDVVGLKSELALELFVFDRNEDLRTFIIDREHVISDIYWAK